MVKEEYFEKIQMYKAVAADTQLSFDQILEAVAHSIEVASRKKYGKELDIKVEINRRTGDSTIYRVQTVVEEVNNSFREISLKDARQKKENIQIGDQIKEQLPPIDLGRVAAQSAKNDLITTIREAIRVRQYEEFKDRQGEIIYGTIKRVERRILIIDVGRAEAIMFTENMIPNESFRQEDRIKAYIEEVKLNPQGHQIFLSRTHDQFLSKLFAQEVPEINDGIIEVKSVSREPGSRSKIAVFAKEVGIDPVGSCVGIRGTRVQSIINELQGEKIDIVPWNDDPAKYVIAALSPAKISKVVIDEDENKIDLVVAEDQLSYAIGRRGQNVRLASRLTGWKIDIITDEQESKNRVDEFNKLSQYFTDVLDVDEIIGQLLAVEGYGSVEEVANAEISDLAAIEGFDQDVAEALIDRANQYLQEQEQVQIEELNKVGVSEELRAIEEFNHSILVKLANAGVKSINDLADLSRDEFFDIVTDSTLNNEQVDKLIMDARNKVSN